jgi:hypothetical protein
VGNRLATDCEIKAIGAIDCSKAQRENRAQVRDREPACSAPAGFPFLGRGDPLMLLLRFKAVHFGRAGKSGRPPPLEPSLKVQRDIAHNQSSGFAVAPRVKASTRAGLQRSTQNGRLGGIHALAPIGRPKTARKSLDSQGGFSESWRGYPGGLRSALASLPVQPRDFFYCSCLARRSAGCPSPSAGFEARPIPSAGKIERPTAVHTVFERLGGSCS